MGEPKRATMGNIFSRKKELSQRVPTMKSKRFNSRHISLNEVTESQSRNVVETDTGLRKINQYKFNSVIGRGSFGEVWLATDDHNISYAIKVLKRSMLRKKRTGMASNALDAVLREVAVLKKVRHPHAVQLFEIIDDGKGDRLFLVMELLCGGEVMADANLPAGESHLPEHLARGVFRDLILGLEYLHVNGVLHRDIKPENIVYETAPRFGQGATTPRGSSSRAFSAVSRVLSSRGDRSSSSKRSTLSVPPSPGGGSLAEKSLRDTPPIAEGSSNPNLAESSASGSKTPRGSKGSRRETGDVRPTPCAKLVDFGVAQMCELIEHPRTEGKYKTDDSVLKSAGTPAFYAPEMCVRGAYHGAPPGPPHTRRLPPPAASPRAASHPARRAASRPARRAGRAADVWAAGVTLCMLAGGKLPFEADNMPEARPPNSKALPGSPPRRAPPHPTPHLAPPPPCPSECSGKRV